MPTKTVCSSLKQQLYLRIYRRPDDSTFVARLLPKAEGTPHEGDIVSFTMARISNLGVPIGAAIYRVRKDLSWDDVVRNFETKAAQPLSTSGN